ncbi:MAG: hypothetical protein HYV96_09365 [Opitutae bacterium]|nr:hypothetical protein [Opitutae bacterium]
MTHVFGTCVYVDPAGIFAFYRVEGTVNGDGAWSHVAHAKERYPNRGTIRIIHSALNVAPSRIGNLGVFEVSEAPNFDQIANDPNAAKYRAVRIIPCIFQVYPLKLSSQQTTEIAALLKNGVNALGELTAKTKLYVQLNDGVVSGPLEMKLKDPDNPESTLYVLDETSALTVKPAWRNLAALRSFEVRVNQRYDATFVGPAIPAPEFHLDFAPLEYSLKKVLDALHDQKLLEATLTKAKRAALAHALASIQSDSETKGRIDTVLRQLTRAAHLDTEFTRLIQEALLHPAVAARVATAVEQAKTDATAEIGRTQTEARATVARLQNEAESIQARLRELEGKKTALGLEIQTLESDRAAAAAKIDEAIRQQFEQAAKNSVALLSEITVLRPFLSAPPVAPAMPAPIGAPIPAQPFSVSKAEAVPLREPKAAQQHLARNLQTLGLTPPRANQWSCEILAAVLVGQAVSFRGSMSSMVANAVGLSLFGNAMVTLDVTVGLIELIRLQPLREALPAVDAWGVVAQGANRSCLDAFGGELVERVLNRSWGAMGKELSPFTVFSLREGPSALVPTPKFSELGPVFHTDAVSWRPCTGNPMTPGSLSCSRITADPAIETDLDFLRSALIGRNSAVFLANAKSALTALHSLRRLALPTATPADTLAKQALQSLACWWVLPFLAATHCPPEELAAVEAVAQADDVFAAHRSLLFPPEAQA